MSNSPGNRTAGAESGKTLFIIDGSSVIYRAFHAIPRSFTNAEGLPTNAVYGFTQSIRKILKDYSPDYIGIAFDVKGPSFRHELYTEYKAERPAMPDDLSAQIPYIKRLVRALNIPVLEKESFEADDIMGTIAGKVKGSGIKLVLITGDKDMYQLVGGDTVILDYNSGREFGPAEVEEKFGVPPALIRDLIALAGDTSDNIPGVPGIGPKTAAKLLVEFGSFDGVYENIDSVSGKKARENLASYKEQAELSRELATLHSEVPFEFSLDDLRREEPDIDKLAPLLTELGFMRLLQELAPEAAARGITSEITCVTTGPSLAKMAEELSSASGFAVSVVTEGEGGSLELSAMSCSTAGDKAWFIPAGQALTPDVITSTLKGLFENVDIVKDTDDAKALYLVFARYGVSPAGIGIDTSIASYLINPSKSSHTVESLSLEYLGHSMPPVDNGDMSRLLGTKAINISRLAELLKARLEEDGLAKLYTDMELPLVRVLAEMERTGIKVDCEELRLLSAEMEGQLSGLETEIYAAAGVEFNINSPKQLSAILFEKLGLKPVKKTKTGFSTDEEVLTKLAAAHEVPQLIISYRQLAKLKSTYVDALVNLTDPVTGRVHTSFNQTVTATGRLSSSKPNLQNIPVRGEAASRIRSAFVAEEGFTLLSADYSQIELRIVAHLSGDPVLTDAFINDEDVHTRTAAEVFGIMPALVTPEMRRRAKAINFGIIYGMGAFGLAADLGVPVKEAQNYIDSYFEHYNLVKMFIDSTIKEAFERGYTTTIFGRRRYIPELSSPVESVKRLGERLAINTPVQGSAADIIKAAMINIDRRLASEGYGARMLLQIHDELVFEVPVGELEKAASMVREEMEGVIALKVPVSVNMSSGPDWSKGS